MKELSELNLNQFIGTSEYYRHSFFKMTYTDGIKYLADKAGCYWLLDIIATEIFPSLRKQPFIVINMKVEDNKAVITADDGNKNVFYTRAVEYTDFPSGDLKLYLQGGVLLLPSEY